MEELDFGHGKIVPVNLEHEMKFSYIDYAMSVIVARALPDVRDGLKPVHRRILYAMQEAGMTSGKPYKKSARIVGEVLGKYHPHGDTSVYDAIVRMAQDFSMRYALADGHGNFGSVDGDPAAAMRYTEVRMAKISELMLQDIDKETVDFVPNYDESLKEPSVLPSKFPQLLVNGTSGIAVAMATNIPPHNLGEVIDATLLLIDDPEATTSDLMKIVHGPDFPTAGLIIGREGIRDAYRTGRGIIKMRARTTIESLPNGKSRIIVTELPYQVNKARLIEKIADLVRDKTIEGITDLRDESDRDGMRIVIDLRRDITPQIILNQLFKHTQLQDSFGVIMLALVDGSPQVLTLKEILQLYIKHQEEVITRRTRFDLAKAKARAHILEGLTIAVKNLDDVIKIVRGSNSTADAKNELMRTFNFSDAQTQAILDLRLQKLTALERDKLDAEYKTIQAAIKNFEEILADEQKVRDIIKGELTEVKAKFNDERRTEIVCDETAEFEAEDLIEDDDIVVTLTHGGYVKRIDLDAYKKQKRGGVGVTGMGTKEEDFVEQILITTTHHTILFFTNKGKVFHLKAYHIIESGRTAKGIHISNLLQLEQGETITAMIKVREFDPTRYLFMATRKGIVKKTQLSEFSSMMRRGLVAIKLDKDDELIGVKFTEGERYIILGTAHGMTITFAEEEVRSMGRATRGVRGIRLKKGDRVIGMDKLRKGAEVLTVSEEGIGKRTPTDAYRPQGRGGQGLVNMKISEKTGDVVGIKVVTPDQELMLITTEGIVIRTSVDDIRSIGRNTQGVILMKTKEDDKVAALATVTLKND
ncbi:MAG: DNA gyrase subunit A [Selenomonadaceae bacterium]|nr:DNA gyrase subunit A [Selenomonadaceae bacterium]